MNDSLHRGVEERQNRDLIGKALLPGVEQSALCRETKSGKRGSTSSLRRKRQQPDAGEDLKSDKSTLE